MSVRVVTRDNTNTLHLNSLLTNPLYLQIMNVLAREELTFQELSDVLKRDEEQLSQELDVLVKMGAIRRHFHHHTVRYALGQSRLKHTIHILYELWSEQVRLAGHGHGMNI